MPRDHVAPLGLPREQLFAEYERRREVEVNVSNLEHGAYRSYKIISSPNATATVGLSQSR